MYCIKNSPTERLFPTVRPIQTFSKSFCHIVLIFLKSGQNCIFNNLTYFFVVHCLALQFVAMKEAVFELVLKVDARPIKKGVSV